MKAVAQSSVFVVRTGADPLAAIAAVKAALLASGNDQPVYGVRTMEQIVSGSMADRRFFMLLLGIFAGLALLLTAAGIYGVISFTVAQRTREMGIRMALGARRFDVLKAVVAEGMIPVVTGLALGLAASFGLTSLMAGMLYDVKAGDPLTLICVAVVLATVALQQPWSRPAARPGSRPCWRCTVIDLFEPIPGYHGFGHPSLPVSPSRPATSRSLRVGRQQWVRGATRHCGKLVTNRKRDAGFAPVELPGRASSGPQPRR